MVIRLKRAKLGIAPFRPMAEIRPYSEADIALLGTDTDHVIGARLGRASYAIAWERKQLGIPAFKKGPAPKRGKGK
jgi:hypothetical protein